MQWNTEALRQCAVFAEIRASGGDSARARSCPKLADSIRHAVAEGCLEEYSSAPRPATGDLLLREQAQSTPTTACRRPFASARARGAYRPVKRSLTSSSVRP